MKQTIGFREYEPLLKNFVNLMQREMGGHLVSIVLYGSVARGTAGPQSDVDVLVILRKASSEYWKRLQPFLPILRRLRKDRCWKKLEEQGVSPFLSLLVLSSEEAQENRYVYLDMIEEARLLFDREGFFQRKLENMRQRLKELGAKRVQRGDDWYWDLKPDLMPGEVITL